MPGSTSATDAEQGCPSIRKTPSWLRSIAITRPFTMTLRITTRQSNRQTWHHVFCGTGCMSRLKQLWAKVRDALEGNMRQQITKLGFFFSVLVAMVGLAAFASGNNLLFLLLASLLSTMLISGFVSRLGLA